MKTGMLLLLVLLSGCSGAPRATVFSHTAGARSYLALGDSYTIGEGIAEHERWPLQLVAALRTRNLVLDEGTILARTGWTTSDLLQALQEARLKGPYRLVSLQIGVNDQFKHGTPEQFRPRFVALLKRAVELAGGNAGHVLVLSIPDYDYGPRRKFAPDNISETIDTFNKVCQEEASQHHAVFVDITELSRLAKDHPELRSTDQIHFSRDMYSRWVEAMLPVVEKMVKD